MENKEKPTFMKGGRINVMRLTFYRGCHSAVSTVYVSGAYTWQYHSLLEKCNVFRTFCQVLITLLRKGVHLESLYKEP